MKLIIGNKNYSSWSLRAWLLIEKFGVQCQEEKLVLDTPAFYRALEGISPTAKVPTLVDADVTVWDSLAICEYINDAYLCGAGWPKDLKVRAKARALAAEMHAGFPALRGEMPMNIRARRSVSLSDAAKQDVARIDAIFAGQWREYGERGGWLFGDFSIADAMYAPVVLRMQTYGAELSADAEAYMQHVLKDASLMRWIEEALQETDIVDADEAGAPL